MSGFDTEGQAIAHLRNWTLNAWELGVSEHWMRVAFDQQVTELKQEQNWDGSEAPLVGGRRVEQPTQEMAHPTLEIQPTQEMTMAQPLDGLKLKLMGLIDEVASERQRASDDASRRNLSIILTHLEDAAYRCDPL